MAKGGLLFQPYFFRTSDGHELDLVLDVAGERWAIETKLSSSRSSSDWDRLNRVADLIGATRRFLVSTTRTASGDSKRGSGDLKWVLKQLRPQKS